MDCCGLARIRRLGALAARIRTSAKESGSQAVKEGCVSTKVRPDSDYVSERLRDGLTVLEALLDAPTRGYTVPDLMRKTDLAYDFVRRALITLKVKGYARQFLGAWKPGDKCRVFAGRVDLAFTQHDNDVLALADSMREF